ncbi:MAG TPA: histidine kinase [Bryobacteraceae bacterium]|nr:histidine kinase [Bryobacteraceae bacterium]
MRLRGWPILALGFGTLVLLAVLSSVDSWRRTGQIYESVLAIHQSHVRTEAATREIESGIYLSGIFARDFLLDPSQITADLHRGELLEIRAQMEQQLGTIRELAAAADPGLPNRLRTELDAYWASLDPIFDWTPEQKRALSSLFLRKVVLPRRNAVLEMAQQLKALNEADLRERQNRIYNKVRESRRAGQKMLIGLLALGIAVSLASVIRISRLEERAEEQHQLTERAEQEMRRLSQQLLRAQEDERRSLSRELHDEIGQTLTAMRVELGNLERLRNGSEEQFRAHLDDAKKLASQTMVSVRNLAAGLRPSVLDDLGLGPALEWQAREFSRRSGIPVEVQLEGLVPELPENYRTCVYRVAQEALTNCARHAEASHIRILLHSDTERLSLAVQDNGRGLPPMANGELPRIGPGLGLIGIEERVKELGGSLAIHSQPGKGMLLKISVPLPVEAA